MLAIADQTYPGGNISFKKSKSMGNTGHCEIIILRPSAGKRVNDVSGSKLGEPGVTPSSPAGNRYNRHRHRQTYSHHVDAYIYRYI